MSSWLGRLPMGTGYLVEGPLAGARWPIWCENWAGDKAMVGPWNARWWASKTWVTWARKWDGQAWEFFYGRWARG